MKAFIASKKDQAWKTTSVWTSIWKTNPIESPSHGRLLAGKLLIIWSETVRQRAITLNGNRLFF